MLGDIHFTRNCDKITTATNQHIQQYIDSIPPDQRERQTTTHRKDFLYLRPTDEIEILSLIGLFYLRGLLKQNYWDKDRLFSDLSGHHVFVATMTRNRFNFLCRHLSFDDPYTRDDCWQNDQLAACREVYEDWNENCAHALQGMNT